MICVLMCRCSSSVAGEGYYHTHTGRHGIPSGHVQVFQLFERTELAELPAHRH